MGDFFNLNVGDYKKGEMLGLLNLKEGFTMRDVVENEEELREKLLRDKDVTAKKKREIVTFLAQVRKILLEEAKKDFHTLPANNLIENSAHMIIGRPEGRQQVSSRLNALERETPGQWERHTVHRLLCLDSRFRPDYYDTMSTDYHMTLPTTIKDAISMELVALEFPSTYYSVSKALGNNYFWMGWTPPRPGPVAPHPAACPQVDILTWYFIALADGNYDRKSMQDEMNAAIISAILATTPHVANKCCNSWVPTCSIGEQSLRTSIGVSLGTDSCGAADEPLLPPPGMRLILLFNRTRGGFTSNTQSTASVTIPPPVDRDGEGGIVANLGWTLGYRLAEYEGTRTYVSEGLYDAWGTKYIYIIVDDFNKNVNDFCIPTFTSSIGNANVLARLSTNSWGSSFSRGLTLTNDTVTNDNSIKKREYFGPVDISKLHVRITDEFGRTLNLNNMDMSMAINFICVYD